MSFLPYAPARTGSLIASFSGSTAIHGAVLFGVLTSSVALLPEPSSPAVREPEYEITLEILDADIIDLEDPTDEPLIPPDAIPLEPEFDAGEDLTDDAEALTPDDALAALAPDTGTLAPLDDGLVPLDEGLLAPEPETPPLAEETLAPEPEVVEPEPQDLAVLEPEPEEPPVFEESPIAPDVVEETATEPTPLGPVATTDPDDVAIDDLSLIEEEVFNPLAEGVAPAPDALAPAPLAPDVVVPEVSTVEEEIAAVVLPDPEIVEPEPQIIAPEPEAEPVAPAALPAEEVDPDTAAPAPEIAEDPAPETENTAAPDATSEPGETSGATGQAVIANPAPDARQIGVLIQRIRATPAPQCVLALPRRVGGGGVGVSMIGADLDELDTVAARVVDGLDPAPAQTREILDPRQCAALDAVRLSGAYPASRIGVSVEDATLESGDSLRARIVGAGGLFLTLLLVDDNGVVQDLARFTTLDSNDPVIDVPVARAGPSRDTRQVLVVLGSPDGPIDLSAGIGREAEDAFGALSQDVLENAVFGLITLDIR